MSGVKINNIVKRSISLSPLVNQWAEEMAAKRGFGSNFSAFLADLVRRAQEGEAAQGLPPTAETSAPRENKPPLKKRPPLTLESAKAKLHQKPRKEEAA